MVLCAHYLKTSKFIPVCISIYILSLLEIHTRNSFIYIKKNVLQFLYSSNKYNYFINKEIYGGFLGSSSLHVLILIKRTNFSSYVQITVNSTLCPLSNVGTRNIGSMTSQTGSSSLNYYPVYNTGK